MRAYTFVILLFCSIASISQNCNSTLFGSVVDLHDGSNLAGAVLILESTEQVVVTDLAGKFTIPNLCNDKYLIQVSHAECRTIGFVVEVKGDTSKAFKLEHHLEELNQVIVSGKAYKSTTKTIIVVMITSNNSRPHLLLESEQTFYLLGIFFLMFSKFI